MLSIGLLAILPIYGLPILMISILSECKSPSLNISLYLSAPPPLYTTTYYINI